MEEKLQIKIPDSWNEVTIGQYQELTQAENSIDRVSILIDEDPELIKKLDPQSMEKVLSCLTWTKSLPEQHRMKYFLEVDGAEYKLVDNLNRFSLGEWVDMDEYQKDIDQNFHLVMAMLYRPAGEYKSEDVRPRAELFRDKVMIGDVYGALVFFSLVVTKSTLNIQRSLIQKLTTKKTKRHKKKETVSQKKERQRSGAGTTTLTV